MKDTTAKRILSTVLSVSLTVGAAGCNHASAETTPEDSQTTTAATTEAAATETTTEAPSTTEQAVMSVENKSFQYRIGDVITFGKYEQDNKTSNGKEDIEWIILDRQGDKVLLISRMALDQQPYNTKKADVTWETCSLRKWLNGSFYESAFDEEDKAHIIAASVTADKNPEYDTAPGNDTKDNVFILSITEFQKYFATTKGIMSEGTKYAIAKEKRANDTFFLWWLRTPGRTPDTASYVVYYGSNGNPVANGGADVDCTRGCSLEERCGGVRPVIRVDLTDYPNTPDKHIYAWVEGYGTAHISYGDKKSDVPDVPCQILYVDGSPSPKGELRTTYGTDNTITEWVTNKVGKDIGYGWEDDTLFVAGSGHLKKTG